MRFVAADDRQSVVDIIIMTIKPRHSNFTHSAGQGVLMHRVDGAAGCRMLHGVNDVLMRCISPFGGIPNCVMSQSMIMRRKFFWDCKTQCALPIHKPLHGFFFAQICRARFADANEVCCFLAFVWSV